MFIYSFVIILVNVLTKTGVVKQTETSRLVLSTTTGMIDLFMGFLAFGASTALAGLRGGFSDLDLVDYCSINRRCVANLTA